MQLVPPRQGLLVEATLWKQPMSGWTSGVSSSPVLRLTRLSDQLDPSLEARKPRRCKIRTAYTKPLPAGRHTLDDSAQIPLSINSSTR